MLNKWAALEVDMTTSTAIHPDYRTGTWKLDAAHSTLGFSVKHLMISKVRGTFEQFDVTIVTGDDPAQSTIEATIDVASVNTRNEARDEHLRTSDFFQVDEHPTATFRSTSFERGAGDRFTVHGDLTLRGVTKPIVITGEFGGVATDGYGQTKAAAVASTTINRHDFGVSWNAALEAGGMTLGDEVTLDLEITVILQP